MNLHIQHRDGSFGGCYLPPSEPSGVFFQTGMPRSWGSIFFSQMEGSSDSPNAWAMLVGWGGGQVVWSCLLGVTLSLSREGHRAEL